MSVLLKFYVRKVMTKIKAHRPGQPVQKRTEKNTRH
jgi:hypothetical protein